ncbi:Riboflavin biosynthesis protein PYRD, chloroplastic [Ananas comosus]|uniref:Riboflavin biosynthesis protein PYRD, chloroplastic n=1 Tax=Ananas comosus TaxID=4615 RepID=A0A199VVJ2_ANACO|nr:Riboflavin biosynthesis protein PYRD, chloroplastic [Ananas comosus]
MAISSLFSTDPSRLKPYAFSSFSTSPRCSRSIRSNRGRPFAIRCQGKDEGFYMRRCVELARKALGRTSPNPMVGCVIVRDGEIVGEGFHPKAGQPHAEVFAVEDAGVLAQGATAFVSLEPCNHYGRTPPCTEALIRAKIRKVIVGMLDPNPIVASKGVERLRQAGIEVEVGVEEELCRKLNEAYIHRMLTGRPFVTLRYTLSFNGMVLNQVGRGAEESGGYYSKLLHEYDGIIMSSNLAKLSSLPTSHEAGANQPLHIIIASGLGSPLRLPFLTKEGAAKVVIFADKPITVESEVEEIEVVVLGTLTLSSVLTACGSRGLCSILLDLRGDNGNLQKLLDNLYDEHLVQKVIMEVCPVWNGSKEASFLAFGEKSLRLNNLQSRVYSESVVVEGYIS